VSRGQQPQVDGLEYRYEVGTQVPASIWGGPYAGVHTDLKGWKQTAHLPGTCQLCDAIYELEDRDVL
jgi:hypothetical protein